MKPTTRDAYRLMHDGSLALSRVEENGIRIDVPRLDKTIVKVEERIEQLAEKLKQSEEWKVWYGMYGRKTKLGGRQQLAKVLQKMGHEWKYETEKGNAKVDQGALEELDIPFVKDYMEIEKLKKLLSTNLKGVRRETVDGLLHPGFHLNLVKTYRSSSSDPNFQNFPIRDKLLGKLVRSCFVPREGHILVEVDFSQLEVRVAACYNRDPVLMEYIETGYDFHRVFAAQCYLLEENKVNKETRYCGKNKFVFPQFYGSWFGDCAASLWNAIDQMKLEANGASLKDHLAEQGITELGGIKSKWDRSEEGKTGWIDTENGTFVDHIRDVEEELWERFKAYARWRKDWYDLYLCRGWFDLLTGFRETGIYKRNDVINHPVQGAAFHCLLWCLIELVKWVGKKKMRTKIVGQIHDSIIADVPREELEDYVAEARDLMTKRIREAWSWIIVPLDIDVEVGEKNWFEKEMVEC